MAEDADGEIAWELIDTAERMGFVLDDATVGHHDIDALHQAAASYQQGATC